MSSSIVLASRSPSVRGKHAERDWLAHHQLELPARRHEVAQQRRHEDLAAVGRRGDTRRQHDVRGPRYTVALLELLPLAEPLNARDLIEAIDRDESFTAHRVLLSSSRPPSTTFICGARGLSGTVHHARHTGGAVSTFYVWAYGLQAGGNVRPLEIRETPQTQCG